MMNRWDLHPHLEDCLHMMNVPTLGVNIWDEMVAFYNRTVVRRQESPEDAYDSACARAQTAPDAHTQSADMTLASSPSSSSSSSSSSSDPAVGPGEPGQVPPAKPWWYTREGALAEGAYADQWVGMSAAKSLAYYTPHEVCDASRLCTFKEKVLPGKYSVYHYKYQKLDIRNNYCHMQLPHCC
jgi:hypothetical protein